MVTDYPPASNPEQSSCKGTQTGKIPFPVYARMNEIDSEKWSSIGNNSSVVHTQQEPALTDSVLPGVHNARTTGKCSRIPVDVTRSRSTQGICETIAGNIWMNPVEAIN
jgi:hypothetical protein